MSRSRWTPPSLCSVQRICCCGGVVVEEAVAVVVIRGREHEGQLERV